MLRSALLAAAVLAVAAPAASADEWVDKSTGDDSAPCTSVAPCKTIQYAVNEATAGETVHIGPGTYAESVVVPKRVALVGAGAGQVLFDDAQHTRIAPQDGLAAVHMSAGGELRNLRAVGATNADDLPAVQIDGDPAAPPSYDLAGLVVSGGLDPDAHEGNSAIEVQHPLDLDLRDSRIGQANDTETGAPVIYLGTAGTARLENLTITPDGANDPTAPTGGDAIRVAGATTLTVADSRTAGPTGGQLRALVGAKVTVERSRFTGSSSALEVGSHSNGTEVTARDSVFAVTGPEDDVAAAQILGTGGTARVNLTRSTLVTTAPDPQAALLVKANVTAAHQVELHGAALVARDSNGGPEPAEIVASELASGSVTVTADRSAYAAVDAGTATVSGTGTVTADAQFTDVEVLDLTLQPGSPLIDAGPPELPGTLDVDRRPRAQDGDGVCSGISDIGATERPGIPTVQPCPAQPATPAPAPAPAPTPQPPAAPRATVPRDRLAPTLLRVKRTGRVARFTLGERAKVTLTVERRKGRRWVRVARITKRLAPGRRAVTFPKLARGSYRLKLQAVDAAGNRSSTRTVRFVRS